MENITFPMRDQNMVFYRCFCAILAPSLFTFCQKGVQGNPQAYLVSFAATVRLS